MDRGTLSTSASKMSSSEKATNNLQDQDDAPINEKAEADGYPKGLKLFAIMLALCLAVFCVALDNTVR